MINLLPSQSLDELINIVDCFTRADQYAMSLSARLQLVMLEDNRVGILNGTDGRGNPLTPTKYRYSSSGVSKTGQHGQYRVTKQVNTQKNTFRIFFNFSEIPRDYQSYAAQTNLTAQSTTSLYIGANAVGSYRSQFFNPNPVDADFSLYRNFTGPPTAPNWEESRVISNYVSHDMTAGPSVNVFSQWEDVRNKDGYSFLSDLFHGGGKYPPRDLTGIRPWGLHNAEIQASYFLQDLEEGIFA